MGQKHFPEAGAPDNGDRVLLLGLLQQGAISFQIVLVKHVGALNPVHDNDPDVHMQEDSSDSQLHSSDAISQLVPRHPSTV
jgi:hypothetical protein